MNMNFKRKLPIPMEIKEQYPITYKLEQMNNFMDKFNELKAMLEAEDVDAMRKMMRHSTERRALFDKK